MKIRKGQMEMMGLAIIIILLSLVFLFVVRFVIMKEPSTYKQDIRESQLAINFLNTLLETNAPDCSNTAFSTLFQDCASNYVEGGMGGNIPCNLGRHSCEYIRSSMALLFDKTFDEWRINYTFMLYTDPESPENSQLFESDDFTGECSGDSWRVKTQPLPLDPPDNLYLSLYICE